MPTGVKHESHDSILPFQQLVLLVVLLAALVSLPTEPETSSVELAYIGPGAGIALLGSFFAVFAALLSAFVALLTWPIRLIWGAMRGRKAYANAKKKRVVIVGLDGLEPTLVDRYLEEGLLPNLNRLRQEGIYTRLGTAYPPLSPVAWSSFSTGTNPGKHNIFDFLAETRTDYLPTISSVRIEPPRRTLRIGKYVIPLSRPRLRSLRKSKPFWNVLGEAGIFSSVLRVPITFPPDKFHGVQLSAMCVPDLLGSQGTFSHYVESGKTGATGDGDVGGRRFLVSRNGRSVSGELVGPENPLRSDNVELKSPFKVQLGRTGVATMTIDGQTIPLPLNEHSEWVRVSFRAMTGVKVSGICRFVLKRYEAPFELYCTPVQIDPAKPVMPVSHPRIFSVYLSKLLGTYATLGLAEDTWSLSEGVLSEDAFLEQAYAIHDERERMLLDALERVQRGAVVCVFDAPDRIQHMFWRFIDDNHPALADRANTHEHSIRDMYVKMDETVGRVLENIDPDTAVIVLSDHGFKPFRCGVDLNAWLLEQGYLHLKNDSDSSDERYLGNVDWSRTRAFAIGLAGIYINQTGRHANGIVAPGEEAKQLAEEICQKLTGLRDESNDEVAIHEAVHREAVYHGPYVEEAPDIIVGYNVGYRVSWDAAIGKCSPEVFSDNTKAWSGDHCIHPDLVPGVLFSNLPLKENNPNIVDLAPTTLELLGVETPRYMDGKSLVCEEKLASSPS